MAQRDLDWFKKIKTNKRRMLDVKRYYMNRVVSFKHWGICFCFLLVCVGCRQELPVTSTIEVDFALFKHDTPTDLYGISLDEIDHAIEGGIYAEMIQNRSFEDGVAPINCRYDRKIGRASCRERVSSPV